MCRTHILALFFCTIAISFSSSQVIKIYSTSRGRLDFALQQANFGAQRDGSAALVTINPNARYQKIIGFGGTFSDATAINLNKLNPQARAQALDALFGNNGIGLNLCRVQIGGNEFSTRFYTLDDHDGDTSLRQFALQNEDNQRIPLLKEAERLRNGNLKLVLSTWTAPLWMKQHKRWINYNLMDLRFGQAWAEYLKKALDAYQQKGVKWWGITTGTYPYHGLLAYNPSAMGWLPDTQSQWIADHLGPVIKNSSHRDIKILGHDDVRDSWPYYAPKYVAEPKTLNYLDGLITDWGEKIPYDARVRDFIKNNKKQLFTLATNIWYGGANPINGNWDKPFNNLKIIYKRLEDGDSGWIDYNLVLNTHGGPGHVGISSDAPLLINDDGRSFVKTPAYYVLGHLSKFIIPGSVRIDVKLPNTPNVGVLGFVRPDNIKVIAIYNANPQPKKIQLSMNNKFSQGITLPAASFQTMLFS